MKILILVLILRLPGAADNWPWGIEARSQVVRGEYEACMEWRSANETFLLSGKWDAQLYEIDVDKRWVRDVDLNCGDDGQ